MRLLLDTHYLIWMTEGLGGLLSPREEALISSSRSKILVSDVSLWEIRIKWTSRYPSGERKGPVSPESVAALMDELHFEWLPLTRADCVGELVPPLVHRDPFDTMLLIQAGRAEARLLTQDRNLRDHPNAYSWSDEAR